MKRAKHNRNAIKPLEMVAMLAVGAPIAAGLGLIISGIAFNAARNFGLI